MQLENYIRIHVGVQCKHEKATAGKAPRGLQ